MTTFTNMAPQGCAMIELFGGRTGPVGRRYLHTAVSQGANSGAIPPPVLTGIHQPTATSRHTVCGMQNIPSQSFQRQKAAHGGRQRTLGKIEPLRVMA